MDELRSAATNLTAGLADALQAIGAFKNATRDASDAAGAHLAALREVDAAAAVLRNASQLADALQAIEVSPPVVVAARDRRDRPLACA